MILKLPCDSFTEQLSKRDSGKSRRGFPLIEESQIRSILGRYAAERLPPLNISFGVELREWERCAGPLVGPGKGHRIVTSNQRPAYSDVASGDIFTDTNRNNPFTFALLLTPFPPPYPGMTVESLDAAVVKCLEGGRGIRMGIGRLYFYRSLYAVQLNNCFKVRISKKVDKERVLYCLEGLNLRKPAMQLC